MGRKQQTIEDNFCLQKYKPKGIYIYRFIINCCFESWEQKRKTVFKDADHEYKIPYSRKLTKHKINANFGNSR